MSIYEKLSKIQMELLDFEFETKNGFHGQYMSLPVLTCKILPKCHEHGLFYYFTANETHLVLKIVDMETNEVLSPAPHVRLPELSKDMKVEGGNYTYMKRYLLMNTFLIIAEAFDPEDTEDGLPASSAKNTNESDEVLERLLKDAISTLEHKGLKGKEINFKSITNTIYRMDKFSDEQKDAIADYVRRYCKKKFNRKNGGF